MSKESDWLEKMIRVANLAAPNGIAALALIFGILMALMVIVIFWR